MTRRHRGTDKGGTVRVETREGQAGCGRGKVGRNGAEALWGRGFLSRPRRRLLTFHYVTTRAAHLSSLSPDACPPISRLPYTAEEARLGYSARATQHKHALENKH